MEQAEASHSAIQAAALWTTVIILLVGDNWPIANNQTNCDVLNINTRYYPIHFGFSWCPSTVLMEFIEFKPALGKIFLI